MSAEYTDVQKRKALGAAYQIISEKRNLTRYADTMFGVPLASSEEAMSLGDVMNCIAILHDEMKNQEAAHDER